MEIATLLGLVELGADRERGPIPPQPAEHVRRSRLLPKPTGWRDIWTPLRKAKPALALMRNRSIALQAHSPRMARAMPRVPVGFERQPHNSVTERAPCALTAFEPACRGMRRFRPLRRDLSPKANNECTPASLRDAIVGGIKNASV